MNKHINPFSLLIKPVGSRCNLNCSYCFYLGKDEAQGRNLPAVMSREVLERLSADYLSLGFPVSTFIWQGGEPTLAGLDFYRRAVEYQMAFGRGGQALANAFQTNGILIDDQWAEFLAEYRFLVGVSLDGPPEVHDRFRGDRQERPTFEQVMKAIDTLRRHKVEFNILCMVTSLSESLGKKIYRFLVSQGFSHLQFIPCVEYDPMTGSLEPESVTPEGYGQFLCEVFDEWYYGRDVGTVSVRLFDGIVGRLAGKGPLSICDLGVVCNHYLVVEKDGSVYPCDFFVQDKYRLGNIMEKSLAGLFISDREKSFSLLKKDFPENCRFCPYFAACYGGCPKDRLAAHGGRFGLETYLCPGLKIFFEHTGERLVDLAHEVRRRYEPQNRQTAPVSQDSAPQIAAGRNDPCPCGSGKKYKHCCLSREKI